MLPPLASPEGLEHELVASPRAMEMQAPLLRGRDGRSVTWGMRMRQGAAEQRLNAGLGPDVWALVIPYQ